MSKAEMLKEEADKGWSLDPRMDQGGLFRLLSLMPIPESEALLGSN